MLIACWSPKGGTGTTVVACGLAAVLARSGARRGALLADLSGDAPAVLGVPDPTGPGLAQWLAAGAQVSLLVLRPCYLALRRALAAPVRPSGVVLVSEPKRALGRRDIEEVLGVPVRAEIS